MRTMIVGCCESLTSSSAEDARRVLDNFSLELHKFGEDNNFIEEYLDSVMTMKTALYTRKKLRCL